MAVRRYREFAILMTIVRRLVLNRRARFMMAAAGASVGTLLMVATPILSTGFQRAVTEEAAFGSGNVMLVAPGRASNLSFTFEPILDQGVIETAQAVSGVERVAPLVAVRLDSVISARTSGGTFVLADELFRTDPALFEIVALELAAGDVGNDGAVVGGALAARLGLTVGDQIAFTSGDNEATVAITGVLEEVEQGFFGSRGMFNEMLLVTGSLDEEFLGQSSTPASALFVEAAESSSIAEVEARLIETIGENPVVAERLVASGDDIVSVSAASLARSAGQLSSQIEAFLNALGVLAVLLGSTAIAGVLLTTLAEDRDQLALLSAMGMSKGTIRRMIVLESALVGAAGALVGTSVGLVTGNATAVALGYGGSIPWLWILIAFATAMLTALLVSLWPSSQASSVDIREVLGA